MNKKKKKKNGTKKTSSYARYRDETTLLHGTTVGGVKLNDNNGRAKECVKARQKLFRYVF